MNLVDAWINFLASRGQYRPLLAEQILYFYWTSTRHTCQIVIASYWAKKKQKHLEPMTTKHCFNFLLIILQFCIKTIKVNFNVSSHIKTGIVNTICTLKRFCATVIDLWEKLRLRGLLFEGLIYTKVYMVLGVWSGLHVYVYGGCIRWSFLCVRYCMYVSHVRYCMYVCKYVCMYVCMYLCTSEWTSEWTSEIMSRQ